MRGSSVVLLLAALVAVVFGGYCRDGPLLDVTDTGMIYTISSSSYNQIISEGIPILEEQIKTFPISDLTGNVNLLVAKVDYAITSLEVSELTIGAFTISPLVSEDMLQVTLTDASLTVKFDWSVTETDEWPYLSDSGTGTASMTGVQMSAMGATTLHPECGSLTLDLIGFEADFGSIKVHLDGGGSALLNMIINSLISFLQDLFAQSFSDMLGDSLQAALNTLMGDNQLVLHIANGLSIDDRYTAGVHLNDGYLSICTSAYVYPEDEDNTWRPYAPETQLPDVVTNDDLQVIVDKSAFQSDMAAMQEEGLWDFYYEADETTDPFTQSLLNTSALASVCPGLYAAYPDEPVQLMYNSTQWPDFSIMPSAAFTNHTGILSVMVGEDTPLAFDMSLGMAAMLDLTVEQNWSDTDVFGFQFSFYNMTSDVLHSDVGECTLASPFWFQWAAIMSSQVMAPAMSQASATNALKIEVPTNFFTYSAATIAYLGTFILVAYNML
ncbi:hypothetical protein KIPB_007709 [Kipferlia bialata]|uniref:Lipid-binding serum glycoprotein N-terminal domain-containing protein n=1 Tax=Kipferlia bialata TaxID=797122 RepID=A0A9K3GKW8_9EUKA|nr:hypothetical protein KIPB_007709 [Kipferlia bialata]|eukprot:g7709.t1